MSLRSAQEDAPLQERDAAEVRHAEPAPVGDADAMEPPPTTPQDAASATQAVDGDKTPLAFIQETADARTRLYSARDEHGAIYAAFYADGRLRVAFEDHRLAGIVQNGHAHLLDMNSELWSEVFVRVTPEGALQLELRDGPLDGRVLTCEALQA